ncbi:MAG TPA: 4-(cytidine 5'-diphospho)-2-C-methyl-D-erythritol kinase [Methylomirabilota bacterium]|nr:4-(cytidine 5'-diphospho)-2-C-methyl-D-erythritol kinase [Methylomirabilota bacterium]
MTADAEAARAKVNLALHIVGRRDDGYHILDTLVVFPPIADTVTATPTDSLTLVVEGPGADALAGEDPSTNLVMRAAAGLHKIAGGKRGAAIRLEKRLPVAAGLGGGSADAAAAIRLLCRKWDVSLGDPRVAALALALGADVPMCLASRPLRAGGVGEHLTHIGPLPGLGILLVNPRGPLPTPAVFRRLQRRDNPPIETAPPPDAEGFLAALSRCRNDLEPPARAIAPEIGRVLDALAALPGCRLGRMSGSGATCFALFDDPAGATRAGSALARLHPGWWIEAAPLG